jgi:DNA polymerase III subunit delta'
VQTVTPALAPPALSSALFASPLTGYGSRSPYDADEMTRELPSTLEGIDAHPHARAVLLSALATGAASHAYLFHGPRGAGKRTVARAFAAALLSDDAADAPVVAGRVRRGTHPDLTWVRPSGAAEMLVADVEGPVVEAASRTPFEASRRVFVIEGAERMNEQAANRLLKTLEEPLPYVHLILLSDDRDAVLPTIASRCQPVRFGPPQCEHVANALVAQGVERGLAQACARLALGDMQMAAWLAGEHGEALRTHAEALIVGTLRGELAERPWLTLLELAKEEGEQAAEEVRSAVAAEVQLLPAKERRRHAREGAEAERRAERRRRAALLDLGLRLAELWLRDAWCLTEGAAAALHAPDREEALRRELVGRDGRRLRAGVELVAETRMRLQLNVSEELALEALSYRLAALLGS